MNQKIWLLVLFHTKICPPNGGKTRNLVLLKTAMEVYLLLAGSSLSSP